MRAGSVVRVSGVTVDITDRKEAEERQALLAREVDHRAKNALALVQSIVRLTRANSIDDLCHRGRGPHQGAVARAHRPVAVALAGRRPARPGRRGARALSHQRRHESCGVRTRMCRCSPQPRRRSRSRCTSLSPTPPSTARCPPSTGRVEMKWSLASGDLELRLDRERRPADQGAVVSGVRHADHQGEHRRPAWRKNQFRMAPRGSPLRPVGAARQRKVGPHRRQWPVRAGCRPGRPGATAGRGAGQSRPGRRG